MSSMYFMWVLLAGMVPHKTNGVPGNRHPARPEVRLSQRRVGQARELERLLRGPLARGGILDPPPLPGGGRARDAAGALAVGLAPRLYPPVGVEQRPRDARGACRRPLAEPAAGRVAPVLRVGIGAGGGRPRPLAVAAGVDHEVRRRLRGAETGRVPRIRRRDLVRAVVGLAGRVVLAGAVVGMAEPPAAFLAVRGKRDATRDPGTELRRVARRAVVGDVDEEALRSLHPGLEETVGGLSGAEPRRVGAVEVDRRAGLALEPVDGPVEGREAMLRVGLRARVARVVLGLAPLHRAIERRVERDDPEPVGLQDDVGAAAAEALREAVDPLRVLGAVQRAAGGVLAAVAVGEVV